VRLVTVTTLDENVRVGCRRRNAEHERLPNSFDTVRGEVVHSMTARKRTVATRTNDLAATTQTTNDGEQHGEQT
jgi:hypothetical protein